eukprot:TRINITY_DN15918_c0_g1_i1.p1 TRINITY_DN15918_c0_g1~~TRINITY_DN15918_c0_g1_i1.p1  ORF type:complete len:237 (-),score=27.28 TRINITY_DN15918_c0_g1_i1:4-714(-)
MIDPNYMSNQKDINEKMRSVLVDWMVAVQLKFRLLPETLFLSVTIVDKYLHLKEITRNKLQLVSIAAMLIAAKYEEIYPPEINDFIYISDKAFTRDNILSMEIDILNTLQFNLTPVTPLHFLRRLSKAAKSDMKAHTLCKYIIEITLLDVKMLKFPPSKIAAAALYISRRMLKISPIWDSTIVHYSKCSENTAKSVAIEVNDLMKRVVSSSLLSIRQKYTSPRYGEIALIPLIDKL